VSKGDTQFCTPRPEPRVASPPWWPAAVVVAVTAFGSRLMPLLHGGGFFGIGNYDDGVYFSAAVALVHGRLPYRDFVFLHPPGVVLALVPFAALGRIVGEDWGFALARAGWITLGALNAVLVARILQPVGLLASVFGGLSYAVFYPAVYVEISTQLQGLSNTLLLAGLALLVTAHARSRPARLLVAGALLGASSTVKIWGVVAVLCIVAWTLASAGRRRGGQLLMGAVLGVALVCLPFFLAAPQKMWHHVVAAQLGRPDLPPQGLGRLQDIVGLRLLEPGPALPWLLTLASVCVVLAAAVTWWQASTRLAVLLLAALLAVEFSVPSWFQHYAALAAPPLALVLGTAGQHAVDLLRERSKGLAIATVAAMASAVLVCELTLGSASFGTPFERQRLARAVVNMPGCIASDSPAALVEMDVFGRNVQRGCPVVVDLNGYTYVIPHRPGAPWTRRFDPRWQRYAMSYFCRGAAAIIIRALKPTNFSRRNDPLVRKWPVIVKAGQHKLVRPEQGCSAS
jgi:hypothetical protein